MPLDPSAKRRCAALAVFTPVLTEDALMDTLWQLHNAMRGDTARDIISAVDQIGQRHALDARTCKRLYEGFYRALHLPDDELPLDPWPAMLAQRPEMAPPPLPQGGFGPAGSTWPGQVTATPAAWAPAAAAVAAVAMTQAQIPVPAPQAPAATDGPPAPLLPAHVQVFSALMQAALADVRQVHAGNMGDLRASAIAALDGARLSASVRALVREAWQKGSDGNWHFDLTAKGLAELVHAFYVALCETLGPVSADQVLTRAVKQAEGVPAARQFSPKQFL